MARSSRERSYTMRPFRIRHWERSLRLASMELLMSMMLWQLPAHAKEPDMKYSTSYRTIQADGLSIFYRQSGPKDAPTLFLLDGLPSSSRMFEPMFARLSVPYDLVPPDSPVFAHSDSPDPIKF